MLGGPRKAKEPAVHSKTICIRKACPQPKAVVCKSAFPLSCVGRYLCILKGRILTSSSTEARNYQPLKATLCPKLYTPDLQPQRTTPAPSVPRYGSRAQDSREVPASDVHEYCRQAWRVLGQGGSSCRSGTGKPLAGV